MSYRNRPHNWYDMDYEAQRAWERDQRKINDAEDTARESRENVERAFANAVRQRHEFEAERERHRYSLDDAHEAIETANEEIARLESENAEMLAALEQVLDKTADPIELAIKIRKIIAKSKGPHP